MISSSADVYRQLSNLRLNPVLVAEIVNYIRGLEATAVSPLKQARLDADMSLSELSDATDLLWGHLKTLEESLEARKRVSVQTAATISIALNIQPENLFPECGDLAFVSVLRGAA